MLGTGERNGLDRATTGVFAELGSNIDEDDIFNNDGKALMSQQVRVHDVAAIAVPTDVSKLLYNVKLVETYERELGEMDCVMLSDGNVRLDTLDLLREDRQRQIRYDYRYPGCSR